MLTHAKWLWMLTVLALFVASGASCPRRKELRAPLQPAFTGPPTTADVMRQVNGNSAGVLSLQTRGASLSVSGTRSLRAELSVQQPRRLRLKADASLLGNVLDLGSNDDMFWMWTRQDNPPTVYFCRHDQFYTSAARQVLPVSPDWLISALGIVKLDPVGQHRGPVPAGPGRLELRSLIPTPEGPLTRVLILDDTQGWVLEQHLYDAQQQLLASALSAEHRRDPQTGVTLAHQVEVRLPPTGMSFVLQVDRYEINMLDHQHWQLWQMPQTGDYPLADLASPQLRLPSLPARAVAATPRQGQLVFPPQSGASDAQPPTPSPSRAARRRSRRIRDFFGR
ncbi:MAG: hypothetical protein MK179_01880 [Pirellulaceae bacterium]|nr:hypothetical protein [Pirellulaceae bacterium]